MSDVRERTAALGEGSTEAAPVASQEGQVLGDPVSVAAEHAGGSPPLQASETEPTGGVESALVATSGSSDPSSALLEAMACEGLWL